MDIIKIMLAIFVLPVTAFRQVGLTMHFFINFLFTRTGALPGRVHDLWLFVARKTG